MFALKPLKRPRCLNCSPWSVVRRLCFSITAPRPVMPCDNATNRGAELWNLLC
jgi:hypothetical protein